MYDILLVLIIAINISLVSLQSACPTPAIRNGAAKLKRRGRRIRFKCYRNYSLVGPSTARCIQGSWSPPDVPVCVTVGCSARPQVDNAIVLGVTDISGSRVPVGSVMEYSCLPGHIMQGDPVSWCDGILWNSSVPTCVLPYTPPRLSCNFNDVDVSQTCGWSQSQTDKTDWVLSNVSSSVFPSGGPRDTSTNGPQSAYDGEYFMFIDASGQEMNSSAGFVSPVYTANYSQGHCLHLAFYMNGVDLGSLRLGQGPEGVQDHIILEEFSGNYGPSWNIALVPLIPVRLSFQIYIDGIVGRSYLSDIAIDAIKILNRTECIAAGSTYTRPVPIKQMAVSPGSCWGRCHRNVSNTLSLYGWSEGACSCYPTCPLLPQSCCSDYQAMCNVTASPNAKIVAWATWASVIGAICLLLVGLIILFTGGLRRKVGVPLERLDGDGDDMVQMVDDEPDPDDQFIYNQGPKGPQGRTKQEDLKPARRFSDLEDIDFTLAGPVDNPVSARKITHI